MKSNRQKRLRKRGDKWRGRSVITGTLDKERARNRQALGCVFSVLLGILWVVWVLIVKPIGQVVLQKQTHPTPRGGTRSIEGQRGFEMREERNRRERIASW